MIEKMFKKAYTVKDFSVVSGAEIRPHSQWHFGDFFPNLEKKLSISAKNYFQLEFVFLTKTDVSPFLNATTRTEELTKCYEPLQKLRVRLWPCTIDLSPPVILYY